MRVNSWRVETAGAICTLTVLLLKPTGFMNGEQIMEHVQQRSTSLLISNGCEIVFNWLQNAPKFQLTSAKRMNATALTVKIQLECWYRSQGGGSLWCVLKLFKSTTLGFVALELTP